jgi:hypothetical protein
MREQISWISSTVPAVSSASMISWQVAGVMSKSSESPSGFPYEQTGQYVPPIESVSFYFDA